MNLFHNKKVFITGGAGFIGSHLTRTLLEQGASVTIYDNFQFGSMENLSEIEKDIQIIRGDILDYDLLKKSMKQHDIVSHQAAQLEIVLGEYNPFEDLESNTIGTLNVLRACIEENVTQLINASSACIYGQISEAAKETTLPCPNWSYGVSKLAAEKYASIFRDYYGLNVFNLRYAITYGEREWYRRVMTIFLKRFLEKKPLVIFGKGEQVRDFVHVKDVVNLHKQCLLNPEKQGEYNVGTGIGYSVSELAESIIEVGHDLFGYTVPIRLEDLKQGQKSKEVQNKIRNPNELQKLLLNPEKSKNEFKLDADHFSS